MSHGWVTLNAAIDEARTLIAKEAPDPETAAAGEAYVSRMVAAGMAGGFLGPLFQQGGLTRALPVHGGPNPDYLMHHAGIDPAGQYRLEGDLNGSERVGVGLYSIGANGSPRIAAYRAFDHSSSVEEGSFALDIAAEETGPHSLAIPAGARILLVRVLHRDNSAPARLNLSGGRTARGPLLIAGSNDASLAFVAHSLVGNLREYLRWTVVARELANQLGTAPPELAEAVQGEPDTQYLIGGFNLAEGEALEVTMPEGIGGYWSLHAYNYWFEHLNTPGVHDRNAVPDAEGKVRIAIGPGLPTDAINGIDTVGHRRGALIFRIVGHPDEAKIPLTRVVRGVQ